jgi:hypothetical protein
VLFGGGENMDVDNCRGCGKMKLKKTGNLFCPDCMTAQSEDLRRVKDYILGHPMGTILDIHRETGVPLKVIQDFIQDRRVQYR